MKTWDEYKAEIKKIMRTTGFWSMDLLVEEISEATEKWFKEIERRREMPYDSMVDGVHNKLPGQE